MPIVHLRQYILQKQVELGRELSIKEISTGSGISRDTISRMVNNKTTRIDEDTVLGLCHYFKVSLGDPVPFLIYDPSPPSDLENEPEQDS